MRCTIPKTGLVLWLSVALLLPLLGSGTLAGDLDPVLGIRDKSPTARAFTNAHIVISPEESLDSATMIIEDGIIVAVGQGIAIPKGIPVTDLGGRWIFPGFIDAYTDYGLPKVEKKQRRRGSVPQYKSKRVGADHWNEAVNPDKMWFKEFAPSKKSSEPLMKLGFTTVQSIQKNGVFRGRAFVANLGSGLANDKILNSHGSMGASFRRGSSQQAYPTSLMGTIALIRQTLYDAEWLWRQTGQQRAADDGLKAEVNEALLAVQAARSKDWLFDGGEDFQSLSRIDRIADEFRLNAHVVASGYEYQLISKVKEIDRPLIVPLSFPTKPEVSTLEDQLDMKLSTLRHWETAPSNPSYLEDAGITFAFTTHRLEKTKEFWPNLHKAMKRGLSEKAALAALTTVPAKLTGVNEVCGSLEKGKLANFFVCDTNLLAKECEIRLVFTAGEEHVLSPIPTTDFTGTFKLDVNGTEYELSLTGKKLSGELKQGEWSTKLKQIKTERNRITFQAKLDSLESSGLTRFSGRLTEGQLSGQYVTAEGTTLPWSGQWTSAPDAKEEKEKKLDEPEKLLARMTYPNKAFGRATPPSKQNVLFRNATVWTADEAGILENTDVLVVDGKISKVGQGLDDGPGITIVDADGKHLTPGIIDVHSHLAISGDVNEGTHSVTPEVRIGDVINAEQVSMYRQLSGGVTTCLTLHGSANTIGGQNQVIKLRWGHPAEELKFVEAMPTIKFAMGENVKQSNWGDNNRTRYPQSRMGVTALMEDVFQAAREYQRDWDKYNRLKKRDKQNTPPPRRDLGLDAIVEMLEDRMLLHCHTYVQTEILALMRLAEKFDFDVDVMVHNLEGYKVADEMARHGAGVTTFSDWWAYKFEVYDAIPYGPKLLVDRGVLTTVKSDNIDLARRLNQEAGKAVMYGGLAEEEAIKLVTINAAKQLGVDQLVGSIAEGKSADLVLWNDHPLSVYSSVEQTWIEGVQYFDLQEDAQMRRDIESEKNALIQKILKSGEKKSPPGKKKKRDRGKPNPPDFRERDDDEGGES